MPPVATWTETTVNSLIYGSGFYGSGLYGGSSNLWTENIFIGNWNTQGSLIWAGNLSNWLNISGGSVYTVTGNPATTWTAV